MTDEEMEALLNAAGYTFYQTSTYGIWIAETSGVVTWDTGITYRSPHCNTWIPVKDLYTKEEVFNSWLNGTDGGWSNS